MILARYAMKTRQNARDTPSVSVILSRESISRYGVISHWAAKTRTDPDKCNLENAGRPGFRIFGELCFFLQAPA